MRKDRLEGSAHIESSCFENGVGDSLFKSLVEERECVGIISSLHSIEGQEKSFLAL